MVKSAKVVMKPRLAFISGREIDYIRNQMVISALQEHFEVVVLTPRVKGTVVRILFGLAKFLFDLPKCNAYFVGFYGQPLAIVISFLQKKTPIILDAYVSTYDTLCDDRHLFRSDSLLGLLTKWVDRYSCRVSTRIITDTMADAEYFQDTFNVHRYKIAPVYVGCDPTVFCPRPESYVDTLHFDIFYYGSFLPLHGTEVIIEAAVALRQRTDIRFILGGDGPERASVQQLIDRWKLDNIEMLGWVPFEQLPDYISKASICLGGHFSAIPKAARVISTKTFQFVAMRKPTIVGDNPAIREVFVPGRDVWAVPMNDPAALATAIEALVDDADLRTRLAQGGYEVFQANFTPDVIARQLQSVVEGALCVSAS